MDDGDPKSGRQRRARLEPPQNLLIVFVTQEPPERVHDRCPALNDATRSALRLRHSGPPVFKGPQCFGGCCLVLEGVRPRSLCVHDTLSDFFSYELLHTQSTFRGLFDRFPDAQSLCFGCAAYALLNERSPGVTRLRMSLFGGRILSENRKSTFPRMLRRCNGSNQKSRPSKSRRRSRRTFGSGSAPR